MQKTEAGKLSQSNRNDFTVPTKNLLARRAGYQCSICQKPTVAPGVEDEHSISLGEASHIYSAAENGPRPNPALTAEERAAPSNGIHLCKMHARLIDVDVAAYPAELLVRLKKAHEDSIRAIVAGTNKEFEPDFLTSHETQVIHGRGSPNLNDLWVQRNLVQPKIDGLPVKHDAETFLLSEPGVYLISGEQSGLSRV